MTTSKTKDILHWFTQINQIPRCSGNEAAIRQWLIDWAETHQFVIKTDNIGNLVIQVPASKGHENNPIVILQAHLDMVCEKMPEHEHDFMQDAIELIEEGDWLRANNTTLGADNGIAIAIALSLVMDETVSHPPLELLFTVEEESGLIGAHYVDEDFIAGRILINLDSEDEGHLTIGCAGGMETRLNFAVTQSTVSNDYLLGQLHINGLHGGHSGMDIHRSRANAIRLLARTLHEIKQQHIEFLLVHLEGGSAHNVIPRSATACIAFQKEYYEIIADTIQLIENTLQTEYKKIDASLTLQFNLYESEERDAVNIVNTNKIIDCLLAMPHGVVAMSTEIDGLVETSNNLAKAYLSHNDFMVLTSQRSAVESRLSGLAERIAAISRLLNGKVHQANYYPAWQPNMQSPLLAKSRQLYHDLFNTKPTIDILHAGLECGVIGSQVEGMDMISFGPTIQNAHSPYERLHIPSLDKVWSLLAALLSVESNVK